MRGFRLLTFGALVVAGGLLFVYLERLGHADWAALLGVALFGLTPPMARVVETPFFLEPVGILLVISFLLAIESGAGWGTLALLATLATLAKDGVIVLSLVPALVLARWRAGRALALASGLAAAVPAAALTPALRWWWTPQIPVVAAPWDRARPCRRAHAAGRVGTDGAGGAGGRADAAGGPGRPVARGPACLRRYAMSLGLLLAMAFLAWLKSRAASRCRSSGRTFERLLLYSPPPDRGPGPPALDRRAPRSCRGDRRPRGPARGQAVPGAGRPGLSSRRSRSSTAIAGSTSRAAATAPWCSASAARPGRPRRDCAGTGCLHPAVPALRLGRVRPRQLGRMRWFLREGWGGQAHYGTNEVVMHEAAAGVLLPILRPRGHTRCACA